MGKQLKKIAKMSLKRAAELCAREFELVFPDGEEKVFVKTQTQTDLAATAEETKAERDKIREKFKKGGGYWNALVGELEFASVKDLSARIAVNDIEDIRRRAKAKAKRPIPPVHSAYKSEADRVNAQLDYENAQRAVDEEIETIFDQMLADKEAEIAAKPKEELIEGVAALTVEGMIGEESAILFMRYRILNSIYCAENHEKRYFDGIEETPDAPQVIRKLNEMIAAVDSIEPFQIKNLPGRFDIQTESAESTPESTEESSTED